MRDRVGALAPVVAAAAAIVACSPVPEPAPAYDPAALRFDGEAALARLGAFVEAFPRRHSGTESNEAAAGFIEAFGRAQGLACRRDRWSVVNFSEAIALGDVICERRGRSGRSIVVVAHHDQSPNTIEGADNDGSGITILLGLMEIFAAEPANHTLVFLAADAEEWGMLGSLRYVETHPDPGSIVAAISLDNLGKYFYDGLIMEPTGQFRGYGAISVQLAARAAARAAGDLWVPRLRAPLEQVLDQAVPISFMDQGPFVAAGVPALGFAGWVPEAHREEHWQSYHSPGDTMALQGARSLHQAGRVAEALVRQLQGAPPPVREGGPYLYSEGSGELLRGAPLAAIFAGIVGLFALGSAAAGGWTARRVGAAWRRAWPDVAAIFVPLALSMVVLRALVASGLMLDFHLYPATPKDPEIFQPRWPAVAIYLGSLAGMLALGRWLARRVGGEAPSFADRKSVALALVAAAGLYVATVNAFSLLFVVPALAWLGVGGRRGLGRVVDGVCLATGGLVLYALVYFFGFVILRSGLGVLWYLMMMFAIGMVSLPSAIAVAAVLAGGAALAVPGAERRGG